MKLSFIFLITLLQLTPTPMPRQVAVTVLTADGQPISGQVIQIVIQRPFIRQECLTDEAGSCLFAFTASGELLNGYLLLTGRGQRSLIWKGERLEIVIQLTATGELDIPTDFTGPPVPPLQTLLAETAVPATPLTIELITPTNHPSTPTSPPTATATTAVAIHLTALPETAEPPAPVTIPLTRPSTAVTFLWLLATGMGLTFILLVCVAGAAWFVRRSK